MTRKHPPDPGIPARDGPANNMLSNSFHRAHGTQAWWVVSSQCALPWAYGDMGHLLACMPACMCNTKGEKSHPEADQLRHLMAVCLEGQLPGEAPLKEHHLQQVLHFQQHTC